MGNKLFDPNWGDDSKSYTPEEIEEAKRRFRRNDLIFMIVALGCCGFFIVFWLYILLIVH